MQNTSDTFQCRHEGCNRPRIARGLCNKHYQIWYKRGLTPEEFDRIVEAQDGKCAICLTPPGRRSLHLDHDHKTGHARGLLCKDCNHMLGCAEDEIEILEAAIEYLQKYQ
jgi:Recombination endonuclease VII